MVVGGGPAGCAAASRLAHLGYDVMLADKGPSRRGRIPHHLPPSAQPLLEAIGAAGALADCIGVPSSAHRVAWGSRLAVMVPEVPPGRVVDRVSLDAYLLEGAASAGARVRRGASVVEISRRAGGGWDLEVRARGGPDQIRCRYVVDASGGRLRTAARRVRSEPATTALLGWWTGDLEVSVAATGEDSWTWASPAARGGLFAATFVGSRALVGLTGSDRRRRYLQSVVDAGIDAGDGTGLAHLTSCDATPRHLGRPLEADFVAVGDAVLSPDPLSSQGYVDAIRSGLQGAAVLHTMATRPADAPLAVEFYTGAIYRAVRRHRRLTSAFYATGGSSDFFRERAGSGEPERSTPPPSERALSAAEVLTWSSGTQFEATPALVDDLVELRTALTHPALAEPTVTFGDHQAADLQAVVDGRSTARRIAEQLDRRGWGPRGPQVLAALYRAGVLTGAC